MKPAGKVIDVNFRELEELLERARQGPLGEGDYQKLAGAVEALRYLINEISDKDATIRRLRAVLGKPSTEKTRTVLEQAGVEVPPKKDPPPPASEKKAGKGHGRNGAEAYTSAERIPVPHATLKPGDRCPKCEKGKVYRLKDPGLRIRVTGRHRSTPRSMSWRSCAVTSAWSASRRRRRRAWGKRNTMRAPRR